MSALFDRSEEALEVKASENDLMVVEAVVDFWSLLEQEAKEEQARKLEKKLREIIIPTIDFNETPLSEALMILEKESITNESSSTTTDERGVRIVLDRRPTLNRKMLNNSDLGFEHSEDPPITLLLAQVPLAEALRYTTSLAQRRYYIHGSEIRVGFLDTYDVELVTRIFPAPPDLARLIAEQHPQQGSNDPFHDPVDSESPIVPTVRTWMESCGIIFRGKASATYDAKRAILIVRNSFDQMELVSVLLKMSASRSTSDNWRETRIKALSTKLDTILMPELSYRDESLFEIMNSLHNQGQLIDREGPFWERGVPIGFDLKNAPDASGDPFSSPSQDLLHRRLSLDTPSATLRQVLERICEEIGGQIVVEPGCVKLVKTR